MPFISLPQMTGLPGLTSWVIFSRPSRDCIVRINFTQDWRPGLFSAVPRGTTSCVSTLPGTGVLAISSRPFGTTSCVSTLPRTGVLAISSRPFGDSFCLPVSEGNLVPYPRTHRATEWASPATGRCGCARASSSARPIQLPTPRMPNSPPTQAQPPLATTHRGENSTW